MPEYHIARYGTAPTVDTFAALELDPTGATLGAITVPQSVRRIKGIRVAVGNSAPVATDSGAVFALRLSGNGLTHGQQDLVVGNTSINLETTGAGGFAVVEKFAAWHEVDIAVVPGNLITLQGAQTGVDVGTPEFGVELVFE